VRVETRRGRKGKRLSTRIFMRFIVLILAVSISFGIVFARHQRSHLQETLVREGLSLASLVSYNVRLGVFTESREFLEDILQGILNQKGVLSCYILAGDGRVLNAGGRPGPLGTDDMEIVEIVREGNSPYYRERPDHLEFWAPVTSTPEVPSEESLFYEEEDSQPASRIIGFVRVDVSNEDIRRSYRDAMVKSVFIACVFLVVGTLIALFFSRRVTTPLKRLNEGAKAIGRGDFSTKIPVETGDEIENLADTFNDMVTLLNRREDEKLRLMTQLNKSHRLQAMGTLTGGIAHDFNNILAIIQGTLENASSRAPEFMQSYIRKSLDAVKRGTDLITQLLHYSRPSQVAFEQVNLALITQETIRLLEKDTDPRIQVQVTVENGLWDVRGDAGQLQQIVMNIYANAKDAIEEALRDPRSQERTFHITIRLANHAVSEEDSREDPRARAGEFVLMSVSDDGAGMDEHALEHVFEPFFTTKEAGKGTGLGLSSIFGIVNRHEGWIDIRSAKGKGTTFDIHVPKSAGVPREKKAEESPPARLDGRETILLVEDEEHIMDAIRERLEDLGYTVYFARDGEGALDLFEKHAGGIHLTILDHVMPGMSGLEVLHRIRQADERAKVIMYSARDLSQHVQSLPGVVVLRKPYPLDKLAGKIRELLGSGEERPLQSHIRRVKSYFIEEKTVLHDEVLNDVSTIHKLFRHMAYEPRETFLAVYLDSQNKIIAYDELSSGTTNKAVVFPKEIVRTALLTNASSVILVHNHPSDDLSPSGNDVIITAAVTKACEIMEITLTDHVIISRSGYYSFSREGMLD
jgi:DNA repair protein RadC